MKNIIENNKLIAEFMGVFDKILSTGNIHSWSDAPFYYTTEDTREKVIKNISKYSKYSKDWNWLMQVVEKMLNVSLELDSMEMYYNITDAIPDIAKTYEKSVEFIKWYNENKSKKIWWNEKIVIYLY